MNSQHKNNDTAKLNKNPNRPKGQGIHVTVHDGIFNVGDPLDSNIEGFTQSSQAMGYPPINNDDIDYKKNVEMIYDKYALEFSQNTKEYGEKYIQQEITLFLSSLKGKKILDVGSGAGRDAIIFQKKGFSVVCIDLSKAMVALCKEKGLDAFEMDIEQLNFQTGSFDGIWAYTSLLHFPKEKLPKILRKLKKILTKNGVFGIAMKEGNFEGYKKDKRYEEEMFISLYRAEDLRLILEKEFEIIYFSKTVVDQEHTYLNYICRIK